MFHSVWLPFKSQPATRDLEFWSSERVNHKTVSQICSVWYVDILEIIRGTSHGKGGLYSLEEEEYYRQTSRVYRTWVSFAGPRKDKPNKTYSIFHHIRGQVSIIRALSWSFARIRSPIYGQGWWSLPLHRKGGTRFCHRRRNRKSGKIPFGMILDECFVWSS